MRKTKIYKTVCLTLGLGIALSGAASQAASITKTLKAVYKNIGISYNGETKKLSTKPFTVNGTTYVPLRAISEIMGADIKWADDTIYINSQTASLETYKKELSDRNFENASLKQQLEVAKKELAALTGPSIDPETDAVIAGNNLTTKGIENTLSKIKTTYKNTYSVEWDYELKIISGRLQLNVSYDSGRDESDFDKITGEERKQFIKEVCVNIAAAHKEVEIIGILKDSSNDVERASYRYTKSGSYEYSQTVNFSFDDTGKELQKVYNVINCIGFSIPINDIGFEEKNNILSVTITTSLRPSGTGEDHREHWNNLSSANRTDLISFIKKIKEDIKHQYSSYKEIKITIRDSSSGTSLAIYEEDGALYINSVNKD